MHRNQLRARLADYVRRFPAEQAVAADFDEFIVQHADCFERTCRVGHITGSAWLLDPSGRRVLLTHHRKLNMWIQLGGHSDGDPDTLAVAVREAEEESGLKVTAVDDAIFDLDRHVIPARASEPQHYHYDVRFLLRAATDTFVVSSESLALKWLEADELPDVTQEPSMLRMRAKWLAGRGQEPVATGVS
ncbi:MAG: NUDIX hydrolase [Pseudomonadota bacterium]